MQRTSNQKVALAVYKLEGEVENWWKGAKRLLDSKGVEVTWEVFQTTFFDKYFSDSVKNEKEAKFIHII